MAKASWNQSKSSIKVTDQFNYTGRYKLKTIQQSPQACYSLEKLNLFHSMEFLFPEYFQSISRIFPYHGQHFRTMELDKTLEIGFCNLFLQYFQNKSRTFN